MCIPAIGFGTYKTTDAKMGFDPTVEALRSGYRLIDTAAMYGNERAVGESIRRSGIDRKDIVLTTKVNNTDRGYDSTLRAFDRSLQELMTDYIDIYLIHWPASEADFSDWRDINASTWRALERLYKEGRCRAIGVSNFMIEHLKALESTSEVMPMVNQIEFHPGYPQTELTRYCRARQIIVEAWSPLGRQRVLESPLLESIARAHGKSVAQICLRWEVQSGVVPIPKSNNPERIRQNLDIFDFSLTDDEMRVIDAMPQLGFSGLTPYNITEHLNR